MKNNTATLNCETKLITFKFQGEIFTVDLTEGDLSDSWNTVTKSNGVEWDINFYWEDDEPSLLVYGLEDNGDCGLQINTSDYTVIDIIGEYDADIYFKEECLTK